MGKAMTVPLALAAILAASFQPARAEPRPGRPNLGRCPELAPLQEGQVARAKPVALPKGFDKVAKANRDQLAVGAMQDATLCVDMRTKPSVLNFALSPDSRFLSFDWKGYEEEGHVLIDRSGTGKEFDTGVAPVFSPSLRRLAAVHQSGSAFSELEGLIVWQVDPVGLRQIATVSNLPEMLDWRIDAWVGEDCINLSAVPFSRLPENGDFAKAARDRYSARPSGTTWRVTRFIGRGC